MPVELLPNQFSGTTEGKRNAQREKEKSGVRPASSREANQHNSEKLRSKANCSYGSSESCILETMKRRQDEEEVVAFQQAERAKHGNREAWPGGLVYSRMLGCKQHIASRNATLRTSEGISGVSYEEAAV